MQEWKRIFGNRKICLGVIFILIGNLIFFYHEQISEFSVLASRLDTTLIQYYQSYNEIVENYRGQSYEEILRQEQEEQREWSDLEFYVRMKYVQNAKYCNQYPEYLRQVQAQAASMNAIQIFKESNSFSNKNIKKTVADYSKLEGIVLSNATNDAITKVVSYRIGDYLVLAWIVGIGYQLVAERKKGLWEIVHSTRQGRVHLALRRLGILLVASIGMVALLYGSTLAMAFQLFGGFKDIHRSVQSISEFQVCTLKMQIDEFLLLYLGLKAFGIFFVGVVVWFVLSAVPHLTIGMFGLGIGLGRDRILCVGRGADKIL